MVRQDSSADSRGVNNNSFHVRFALSLRPLHLAIGIWVVAVGIGFGTLLAYTTRAGNDVAAPARWPDSSSISRNSAFPTLLVFAHPCCPCTEATLEELAAIVARAGHRVSTRVVFLAGPKGDPAWTSRSRSWQKASSIPGAQIVRDEQGVEATRFGAETSGRTLLFDAAGRLVFQGGITGARGETGPNAGAEAVTRFLGEAPPGLPATPAFGCRLFALGRTK